MALPSSSSSSSLTFADLLRYHRTAARLTQEELAERAGLSVDAISTLERGARRRPRKDTVALLADALALPDEERAAFAAAARRTSAASLTATPPAEATSGPDGPDGRDGHVPALAPASDATLPHGIVTFLFADLEGSSWLLQRLGGDRYAALLAQVQALLSSVWAAHAGHELGTQGDHFFVVFADVEDALAAVAAAQRALAAHEYWPDGMQVLLRMGVHTGSALFTAGRYVGLEVQRAARVAAAGHGGQVVVSHAVADQVAKFGYELPAGTELRDLGTHRLEGLPHREQVYQLVLLDLPGLPAAFPPLRTLDAWPGLRADLMVVVCMSAGLLAVIGLLLALVVPAFPWEIGLVAAGLAGTVLLGAALAEPVRRALASQWRIARKPFATVTSTLLSLVVVVTTLFVTKPPTFIGPSNTGYDFSYTYHQPARTGGEVVIGMWRSNPSLAPPTMIGLPPEWYEGLWNGCVTQLPDLTLGLKGWKADQCVEVPTIFNGGETPDEKTTVFRIDPHAVWSDGVPITADDFLFGERLAADPNIIGSPPFNLMTLSKLDTRTVRIDWSQPYGDYLTALAHVTPLPLHAYATGAFAGVYDAATGAYDTTLAQQLVTSDTFNYTIPVDNGPFTVQSVTPDTRAVLTKNPRFYSNFFHHPATLDKVTIVSLAHVPPDPGRSQAALVAMYRQGGLTLAEGLEPANLSQLGGIPKNEMVSSPLNALAAVEFNQRDVAPNARSNGGTSIFGDFKVRKAFVEAFDRCAALRSVLGIADCTDPDFHTDELTAPPSPDYDPSVKLPAYNPIDAAALLNQAGYRVVDGVRRFKDGKTPMQLVLATVFGGSPSYGIVQKMQQDYTRNLNILVSILAPSPPSKLFDPYDQGGVGATGAFDLWIVKNFSPPDPVGNFVNSCCEPAYIPSAQNPTGGNYMGAIDPHVAAQDRLGSQTLDADQRAAVYRDLQRYLAQQLYSEPVYIVADVTLAKPTLCNFKKWPAPGLNTWNMADWYLARGSACP